MKAAPSDEVVVADAEADAPVAVPVPPETPVGSLGCRAVLVVDSEPRLVRLVLLRMLRVSDVLLAESVGVVEKVMIGLMGPPGVTLAESESVVSGSETTLASAAMVSEGVRRRRVLRSFILVGGWVGRDC